MDKLQPLIRHRFWLLFGLALPLALAGYFMTSGKMTAATEEREQTLEKTLKDVPKGVSEPNETYAAGLNEINEALQAANKAEVQKLWEAQRERMEWPSVLLKRNYIPNEYRGEIRGDGRQYYTQIYPEVIKRVWEKAEPVVGDPPPPGLDVTWDQKVLLLPETVPVHQFPPNMTPTNKQIWDAQEDVWLLGVIFDGIVRANKKASWIGDAPIRSIDQLYLLGGSGKPALQGAGGGVGGFGGGDGPDRGDGGEFVAQPGGGAGAGRAGGMGRGLAGPAQIGFNPAEEFGEPVPDPEAKAAAEQAGIGGLGGFGNNDGPDRGDGGEFVSGAGGGRNALGGMGMAGAYRYIGTPQEVENEPYRERGFYISAIVMLPELPSIFAAMSSSDWPIRILRFQVGPNPHAPRDLGISASPGGFASRSGRGSFGRGRMGSGDEGEDYASGGFGRGSFGRGGLGRSTLGGGLRGRSLGGRRGGATLARTLGSRAFGNSSDNDTGDFGGGRGGLGMGGGGIVLPISMQGPYEIDPNWFANPDLVQVDFCGIITMYNPQTDDTVVPESDGSSEEDTPEAIAQREEELKEIVEAEAAAAEAAASEAADVSSDPADPSVVEQPISGDSLPASDADAASNPDETTDGPAEGNTTEEETTEPEAAGDVGPDEPPATEIPPQ